MTKAVLIGYGRWGKRLLPKISEHFDNVTVVRSGENWRRAVQQTGVEHVFIATPREFHFSMAIFSLSHGRHVFVEKPTTDYSVKNMEKLLDISRMYRTRLFTDYTWLYNPKLDEFRSSNRIYLRWVKETDPLELYPHVVAMAHYLLGDGMQFSNGAFIQLRQGNPLACSGWADFSFQVVDTGASYFEMRDSLGTVWQRMLGREVGRPEYDCIGAAVRDFVNGADTGERDLKIMRWLCELQ